MMNALRVSTRWLTVLIVLAGCLCYWADGAQPVSERSPEAALKGRTIRVGLPDPVRARGMLQGTRQDPHGFLKQLIEEIAVVEGLNLEFVIVEKDAQRDSFEALQSKDIDVVCGMMVTEQRMTEQLCSGPVMVTKGVAITRVGTKPPTTLDELRRMKVVVPLGGAGRTYAIEHNLPVIVKPRYPLTFDAVLSGEADVLLTTMASARQQIQDAGFKGLQESVIEPGGFSRAYAYGVRKDDAALMASIDRGLAVLRNNGRFAELYQRDVERYQPIDAPRSIELSQLLHWGLVALVVLSTGVVCWQWWMRRKLAAIAGVLRESEQRYRGIFDHSQDAIFVIDPVSLTLIEANKAAEALYGYGQGEMVGLPVERLVAVTDELPERVRRVLEEKSLQIVRAQHRRRDGRLLLIDVSAAVATIAGKTVIVAMNRDVTAARSYEELIRAVIESSPHVAIQGFNKEGRVSFWNEASESLYGWSAGDAAGKTIGELIGDAELQTFFVDLLQKLEAERRPSGLIEFKVHNRDGEPRWVLSEVVPAPNIHGELQFVCVDIDVSAMKRAERRLQDAQARLASALEAAGTGTWSIDVAAKTIDPDPSLLRLVGLDPRVTGPRPLSEIAARAHPQDLPQVMDALGVALRGEGPYRAEYRIVLPGGGTRWLSSRGKLIRNEKGEVVSVSGACVDVTEAKQAEADAQRLRDQLESARRLESLGLLAGGLAHDFNNLLVGIRGNTELALRELDAGSPARSALDLVVQATDRTAELTNQLLATAGQGRLAPEPIDLSAVAAESVELLRPRLGQRVSVAFELAAPPEEPARTLADATQIRQALSNLLANAADAMGDAGGRIVVRTGVQRLSRQDFESPDFKVSAEPGEFVYIEVADSGSGMDEQTLARVFDPFYSTKATGRGLGLSLVLMTVRRHDGAIRIRSTPGAGTSFRLFLPLVAPPVERAGGTAGRASKVTGRALVIDDDAMVRQVITAMLGHEGWDASAVGDGTAGLERLRDEAFDVVFLDLTMPGMSGTETAAALRAAVPHQPIVFVSGYNRESADARGVLVNEVFVQKPFNTDELTSAAAEAIERSGKKRGRGLVAAASAQQPDHQPGQQS